jgi:hypothetical protein
MLQIKEVLIIKGDDKIAVFLSGIIYNCNLAIFRLIVYVDNDGVCINQAAIFCFQVYYFLLEFVRLGFNIG